MSGLTMMNRNAESGSDDSVDGEEALREPDAESEPSSSKYVKRFMIRNGHRIAVVRVSDVDSIVADGNYIEIHAKNKVHRLRSTLHEVVARLDPGHFVRIHKSTVINLDVLAEIQEWFGGDYIAILKDGRQLRISRTYARALLDSIR